MFRELFPVTNEDSFTFVSEEWIDPHRAGTMQEDQLAFLPQQVCAVERVNDLDLIDHTHLSSWT